MAMTGHFGNWELSSHIYGAIIAPMAFIVRPLKSEILDRIARESGGLPAITTEKDLVRLPDDVPFSVGALRVEVEYLDGWEEISRMILERLEGGARP